MSNFNEETLESAFIELLKTEGYTHLKGENIHKEISDVLLREDLQKLSEKKRGS